MSKWDDAYPIHPSLDDARAMLRAEAWRDRELADLPDALTDEEAEEADSAYEQWLKQMAS